MKLHSPCRDRGIRVKGAMGKNWKRTHTHRNITRIQFQPRTGTLEGYHSVAKTTRATKIPFPTNTPHAAKTHPKRNNHEPPGKKTTCNSRTRHKKYHSRILFPPTAKKPVHQKTLFPKKKHTRGQTKSKNQKTTHPKKQQAAKKPPKNDQSEINT